MERSMMDIRDHLSNESRIPNIIIRIFGNQETWAWDWRRENAR
jgi:hypothetical protein